jgi:hypothetical protein
MFNLTPDQTVLAGVGIAGAMLATFHPAVEAKIKSFLSSAWARLSGANKVCSQSHHQGELSSPNDVHILVTQLVAYFSKKNDPEGVKCAARIGTHVYEQQVSDSLTVQGAT